MQESRVRVFGGKVGVKLFDGACTRHGTVDVGHGQAPVSNEREQYAHRVMWAHVFARAQPALWWTSPHAGAMAAVGSLCQLTRAPLLFTRTRVIVLMQLLM